jgi:hypothetical protein
VLRNDSPSLGFEAEEPGDQQYRRADQPAANPHRFLRRSLHRGEALHLGRNITTHLVGVKRTSIG